MTLRFRRCALLASLLAAEAASASERPIAIVHARLVDGRGSPVTEDATLLIRDRLIEAVGGRGQVLIPKNAQLIDASGKTVMPGLADMHVHLQGGWDGISMDLLGHRRYLNAMLYAGVTTVLDTGNYQPWILQLRQEVANGRLPGPHIYCVGAMIDGVDWAWPDFSYPVVTTAQLPGLVHRKKQAGVDLIKGYANLSDTLLERLAAEAAKQGLRVVVDEGDRDGSPELVAYGVSGFAHMPFRSMPAEDVQLLDDKGVFVITTLASTESHAQARSSGLAFLHEPLIADTAPPWFLDELTAAVAKTPTEHEAEARRQWRLRLEKRKTNARKLLEAGVLIVAGTDAPNPGVFYGEGLHRELELLVESGLTPLQAIRAATYDAARMMKAEREWGSLEAGSRADVLVIAGRPDERISDTRKLDVVIREGRILDRRALRFDAKQDPGYHAVPGVYTYAPEVFGAGEGTGNRQ
jgi:imidazolonepropionase-like amidohydrolase